LIEGPNHRTHLKIFLSKTICSIRTKFWWNSLWMILFQKCVWRFDPSIHFFFYLQFWNKSDYPSWSPLFSNLHNRSKSVKVQSS
jgi:hypothetical protein